jgi:two-component system, sensor histidine kinase ChiS
MRTKVVLATLMVSLAGISATCAPLSAAVSAGPLSRSWDTLLPAFNLVLITVLLVAALLIFLLALFNYRKELIFLGIFAVMAVIRSLVTGQRLLLQLLPGLSPLMIFAMEYLSLFAGGAALALFLLNRYPARLKKTPFVFYTAASLALMPLLFLTAPDQLIYVLSAFVALTAGIMLYVWPQLLRLFLAGDTGAGLHLLGTLIMLGFGINDYLLINGLLNSIYLLPLGLLIFLFLHALVQLLSVKIEFDKVRNMQEHMRTADRLKDEFLANTSHELRTPIHGIVGLAESMLRGAMGELNKDQTSTLSLVVSSGLRLSAMVNDILDFSKMREGGIRLQCTEVDLYQAVLVVGTMCRPLLMGRPLELINEIDPHSVFVLGDESRIEQIFYNLIGTAIKFTEEGEIRIRADEADGVVTVSVETQGMSLEAEKVHNVFTAYETDNLRLIEGFEGTGLGLAITKRLVELHEGEISYATDAEGRTAFSFTLPTASAVYSGEADEDMEISLDALEHLESLNEDNTAGTARFTLLVADDNPVNLQVMKNQLSGDEFRIVPVLSGKEALVQLEKCSPDLVLLDIMMPGMNGYEVCRLIREQYTATDLPVILVTAKSEVMDMEEGLQAGANDFLAKPYTQEEFLTRIRTHLNLARINTIYSRFVPMEFLNFLGHDNIVDIQLGDQVQKEMTVLFVDIRAFTALSESMTPQENFKFINSFLSRLSPMIQENGGIIDKYIGDSIMALFPNRPEDAIKAAIEMVRHMELYNKQRATCGYRPISIGVGIHTGNLILGIIGDEGRMQGTVISDAVNLASRIQDVTKLYGANIIISQESFIKLDNPTEYSFRFLGKVRVKGKNRSVSLFEIFDGDMETMKGLKTETKTDFESAILRFSKREFDESSELFKQIIAANPNDRAARLFLEKAEAFIAQEKRRFLFSG